MYLASLPYITILWFCCLAPFCVLECFKKKKKKKKNDQTPSMKTVGPKSKHGAVEKSKSKKENSKTNSAANSGKPVKSADTAASLLKSAVVKKSEEQPEPPKEEVKTDKENKLESKKILPYPSIKEYTPSTKVKKEQAMEKDKKEKIKTGFFQSKSDEDDTLEKITSLKPEDSEGSKRKKASMEKAKKEEEDKDKAE